MLLEKDRIAAPKRSAAFSEKGAPFLRKGRQLFFNWFKRFHNLLSNNILAILKDYQEKGRIRRGVWITINQRDYLVSPCIATIKNTISQREAGKPLTRSKRSSLFSEIGCLLLSNGVPTQSERSAYPFSKKSLPFFQKVYTLFPKTL